MAEEAKKAVFVASAPLEGERVEVRGYDFDKEHDISDMLSNYYHRMGFQATQLGQAIDTVNQMVFADYRRVSWDLILLAFLDTISGTSG